MAAQEEQPAGVDWDSIPSFDGGYADTPQVAEDVGTPAYEQVVATQPQDIDLAPVEADDSVDWDAIPSFDAPGALGGFEEEPAYESPIQGLTVSGGEIVGMPDELAEEPPSQFAGREGHLTKDEASMLWYQTRAEYDSTRDSEERVKILGRFMRAWDPGEADRMGLSKEGFIEPEGLWKFVDALDKPAKVVRTLLNTMYDLRKEEAAHVATDGEIDTPDMESVANALQRNWAEDKGTPEDGARAMRSSALWLATMLQPETKEGAANVLSAEAGYEEGEDKLADWMVEAGWGAASPLLKVFTGATEEEIQQSIKESIEAGSAGGHFAIGLLSLMLIDPLNALSGFGGAAKGAGEAATSLLRGGASLTPAGIEAAGRYSKQLEGTARQVMVAGIAKAHGAESVVELQAVASRLEGVDKAIDSYEGVLRASPELAIEGAVPGAAKPVARITSVERAEVALPKLADLKVRLVDEFDAAVDALKVDGKVPGRELRQAAESRAAVVATADYNDAINLAWQNETLLRGDFAVGELASLRAFATDMPGVNVTDLERFWVDGLRTADKEGGVLVRINVDDTGKLVDRVIKSPEVALLYRQALDGDLGVAAKVSASRPEYNALETLLGRGIKGKPTFAQLKASAREEIVAKAAAGTTRTERVVEGVVSPAYATIRGGKKGREAVVAAKADIARHGNLVKSIDPIGFKMAYALAGKFSWIDRHRRMLAGVYRLTIRPAAYATKGADGTWTRIPREQLIHPSLHYNAQKSERNRIRSRMLMMRRWPQIRASIEAMTGDPEVLKLARHFVEKGWADVPSAAQAEKELLTAVSLRRINEVISTITKSLDEISVAGGEGKLKILSREDTESAVAALRQLKQVDYEGRAAPGIDPKLVDELVDEILDHGSEVEALQALRAERAGMKVGAPSEMALRDRLKILKQKVGFFSAAFDAQVRATLRLNTDIEITRLADDFRPELERLQGVMAQLEVKLQARKSDDIDYTPIWDEVDALLRQLEEPAPVAPGAAAEVGAVEAPGVAVTKVVESKHPPRLAALIESGRYAVRDLGDDLDQYGRPSNRRLYEYRAKGTEDWPTAERVTRDPDTGQVFTPRSAGSYDPELVVVSYTESKWGTDVSFSLKEGFLKEVPQDDALMYRGMSWEEFESVRASGKIKSLGEYNLGPEQEGLTYFTSNADSGTYYASGFAPVQYKPVPEKPAVVVSVRKREGVPVAGTGEHEIGIRGSIPVGEIVDVWVGRPYRATAGKTDVVDDFQGFRDGSGVAPDSSVAWKKEDLSFSPPPPKVPAFTADRPVGAIPVKGARGKAIAYSDGTPPLLNEDGTITLYHWTSKALADHARKVDQGDFSEAAHSKYLVLSNRADGVRPKPTDPLNDGEVLVELRVNPKKAAPVESFDGEVHLKVHVGSATVSEQAPFAGNPWTVSQEVSGLTADEHLAAVRGALEAGQHVPIEVLVEYPTEMFGKLLGGVRKDIARLSEATKQYKLAAAKLAAIEDLPPGATALQDALRKGSGKAARVALDKAKKHLQSLQSSKDLVRMQRALNKVIKANKQRDLVIPYGSPKRARLQAVRDLYKQNMASINGQIQDKAILIRTEADEQQKALLEGILPKEQLSEEKQEVLHNFTKALQEILVGKEPAVAAIPRGRVNKLLAKISDPKFAESVERKRRYARRIKDPARREVYEAALENSIEETLSSLEAQAIAGVELSPLSQAISMKASRPASVGLPGQFASKKEVLAKLDNLDGELDDFLKAMEEVNYDLRHPKDVRRGLEEAVTAQFNKLQKEGLSYESRLDAFRQAETMRLVDKVMTPDQISRVTRMVRDPDFHDIITGKAVAVEGMTAELAKAQEKLSQLEADGKGDAKATDRVRKHISVLEKRIAIMGDETDSATVLGVAKIMKKFFGDWLDDLKAAGVMDENLDPDEFFARVDVAGYIPHMSSLATQAKIQALRGRGLLPSHRAPGFLQKRDIPGVIDDINVRQRDEIAKSVLYHQAEKGAFGQEAVEASRSLTLEKHFNDLHKENPAVNKSWDQTVEGARIEHGLDDMYDFFETDPLVLMERYNSMASRSISDAAFIEDILDMFPLGRTFTLYGDDAVDMADRAGYVRLDTVTHLESVIRAKLPAGLRQFEATIKRQLAEGVPRKEIMAELEAAGVNVTPDIIDGFNARDVYIPKQVAEYLNWMNTSDAAYANSMFGKNADAMHSWMKAQATIIAMAHIGRNFIGNVVSSVQELGWAAVNPMNQAKALRIWGSWGDDFLDAPVQIGKYTMSVSEWRAAFREEGFFDVALSHDFMLETTGLSGARDVALDRDVARRLGVKAVDPNERMVKTLGLVGGTAIAGAALGAMAGLAPLGAFAGVSAGLLGARRWNGVKAVRGGSAMQKFVGMTAEEIKRAPKEARVSFLNRLSGAAAGALVGSATANPLGMIAGAAIGAMTMPDYLKMMGQLNQSVEAQARLSMAVGALNKGMSIDDALVSTNRALRDYSDLTPLEKNVLRRVFFFWTWEAGNMKFQLDWLRRRPRAANMTFSFLNGVFKGQFTEDEISSVAEHQRYQVLLRTGAGRMMAISGLPQEPMLDILTRGKRGVPTGLMTRLNPIPLTMFEWLIGGGKSVYYGKDWEEINNVRKLKNAPNGLKSIVGFPGEGEETWVPVYKDGVIIGSKPEYRAKNPALFYLMRKVPMWRVIQQYMVLSADTFNSYALDAGMPGQKATRAERALAFTLGWRPTTIDFEQNRKYMAWRLEQDLLDIIHNRHRGAVKSFRRLAPLSAPEMPINPLDGQPTE